MGYSAIIGGKDQFPLASTSGWEDAKAWIDTLDAGEFESLVHLAEYAWTENLKELRQQIASALKKSPPSDATVADTMAALIETLSNAKGDSIFVSDGTSDDNGDDSDGWDFGYEPTDDDEPDAKTLAHDFSIGSLGLTDPNIGELLTNPPSVPDFDALGEQAMRQAESILARVRRKLLNHDRGIALLQTEMDELDLLVAQSYLASQLAGAVAVFSESQPQAKVYQLDSLHGLRGWDEYWKESTEPRFPWVTEASRWLESRGVVPKSELPLLVQKSEDAASLRWDSIRSVADLSKELSDSLISGETVTQFRERIDKATTTVRSQLETGFLTATHQAYIHGKTNTLEKPFIKRLFPAVEYFATMDTRTRDTHRVLDGIAVEVDSPAYVVIRRALADYRCRCNIITIQKKNLPKYRVIREVAELPASVVEYYASGGLIGV